MIQKDQVWAVWIHELELVLAGQDLQQKLNFEVYKEICFHEISHFLKQRHDEELDHKTCNLSCHRDNQEKCMV